MAQQRKIFRFRGDVQGVGFRVNALQQSRGLSISGFVRNEIDGDVTMDVQGPAEDVNELARRIAKSMEFNISETLVESREPIPNQNGFQIR